MNSNSSPSPVWGGALVLLGARALGLVTLGLLAVAALTPLPNVVARRLVTPDPPMPADAIVALAAMIYGDGSLSDDSIRRFIRATELYKEGVAPLLVLSGVQRGPELDEGKVRAALARRLGVPTSAIVTVTGHHTRDEALAVVAALRPRGARRVLVVTDWAHAGRVRATFKSVGLDVRVAVTRRPADAAATPHARLWLAWECAREFLARVYYRLVGFA